MLVRRSIRSLRGADHKTRDMLNPTTAQKKGLPDAVWL